MNSTFIIIMVAVSFFGIFVLVSLDYILDKYRTVYSKDKLKIKYKDLKRKEANKVRKWARELKSPVSHVFNILIKEVDIKWEKIANIEVIVQPDVYRVEEKVRGLCFLTGEKCLIEFGDDEYMTKLLYHEVGHSIIITNNIRMSYDKHHEIMGRNGF